MPDTPRLISDGMERLILDQLVARNALYRWTLYHEPWESRLKREIWRRSLRGRWWLLRYGLLQRTASVRRRIAHAIYAFEEAE